MLALGAIMCAINALSILHDEARDGPIQDSWEPWASEYTSLLGLAAALPVVILVARELTARRSIAERAILLAMGSAVFSLVHVATMVGARTLLWSWWGLAYSFDVGGDWLYEFRKDLFTYGVGLVMLILGSGLLRRVGSGRPVETATLVPLSDGRRTVPVAPAELIAIRGAGNYVELLCAGGERTLLRTTLEAVGDKLAGHGFLRIHKSWLVHQPSVIAVDRNSSGDFVVSLRGGATAPGSRTHRRAIRTLLDSVRTARTTVPPTGRPQSHRHANGKGKSWAVSG